MRQLTFDGVESQRDFGFKPSAYRELPVENCSLNSGGDVLPILSQLSHRRDERWLTCVNTPVLGKDLAREAGIAPGKFLRVNSSTRLDTTDIIKRALRSGCSHTVVGFCSELTYAQREELKQCAELADCECLVLTEV